MTKKPRRAKVDVGPWGRTPLPIVGDAALASVLVGDARMIPLLIVDTEGHPDAENLFRAASFAHVGQASIQWAKAMNHDDGVALLLNFSQPVEATFIIEFGLDKYAGFVDVILTSRALYLQAGKAGDRLVTTIDAPRLLQEIPDTGFDAIWDAILRRHLLRQFRSEGMSKADAREAFELFLHEWRGLMRRKWLNPLPVRPSKSQQNP